MEKISATIITFNEEKNIERCLKSLELVADEIIVVDSFSTDKTKEICQKFNVRFYENAFAGYGQQKNFAAEKSNYHWIMNIDADEVISENLKNEILEYKNSNQLNSKTLYKFKRLTNYCGKWIYHGGWYPNITARVYHKDFYRWTEPKVHETLKSITSETVTENTFTADLLHYSFPTIKSQILTNVKYAELGNQDLIKRKGRNPNLFEMLYRPFWKFIECYFIKLGFLDGKEGLFIALNAAYSMFMKYTLHYQK